MYEAFPQNQPDSYCCVPTAASMGIDQTTAGVKRPDPENLRRSTGIPHPYGISYRAIADATADVSAIKSEARYGLSRSQVVALANSGRPWSISIWTGVTYGSDVATGYFIGGHTLDCPANNYSLFIPDGSRCTCERRTTERHNEFKIQDPGTYQKGYVRISADLLFRAAEERTRRAGTSGINVLVFPDTTDVYRMGTGSGWVRTKPGAAGAHVRRVEKRKYHVLRIVEGDPYFVNGHRSTGWYQVPAGFIRGDKLGTVNVSAP